MGRYCRGDIDHKLWFGLQASDAASQFGGESEPDFILYEYWDLNEFCLETFDELIKKFNDMFKENVSRGTNPEWFWEKVDGSDKTRVGVWMECTSDKTAENIFKYDLELAADLQLGLKIYQHILSHGKCNFTADLG